MIRYALKCAQGHGFESWFANGDTYDRLRAAGHVACTICGDTQIEKALMAPSVAQTRGPSEAEIAQRLRAMREAVEKNSEYVGMNFVTEARAIHSGDSPERPIWGEARLDEAKALLDEGVPVAPLPFVPRKQVN
jgi:hypothetical protein